MSEPSGAVMAVMSLSFRDRLPKVSRRCTSLATDVEDLWEIYGRWMLDSGWA